MMSIHTRGRVRSVRRAHAAPPDAGAAIWGASPSVGVPSSMPVAGGDGHTRLNNNVTC